jgi:hypothetical protein
MNRRTRWMGLLGVGLALIGVWGAWVPHRAAALVLRGWDLAEFVKFVPGAVATRELFYLPVWCAGMALAVMIYRPGDKFAARVGPAAIALGLMMALLPPYPDLLRGYQSPEFRWQFLLGTSGALVVLLSFFLASLPALWPQKTSPETISLDHNNPRQLSERWPAAITGGALVVLALVGAIPALWQFLEVRGAIEAVYGTSLGWGWGLGVFLAGWGLVGAAGGRVLTTQGTHSTIRST